MFTNELPLEQVVYKKHLSKITN